MSTAPKIAGTGNFNMFFYSRTYRGRSLRFWGTFKPCPSCGKRLYTNGKINVCFHCEEVPVR